MTIPFLQVKPKSIKLKVSPRFPAQLLDGVGTDVIKANGNYSVNFDYSNFPAIPSIAPADAPFTYTVVWNIVNQNYSLVPIGSFAWTDAPSDSHIYGRQNGAWVLVPSGGGGITDAPSDGSLYGRLNAAWTKALPLSGGTLTGTLTLNADPVGNLDSATKQYVDAHAANGVVPENSQSANYTTVLADAGKLIHHPASDANARTFTIASNASVAYTLGTVISFTNLSANAVTIAIATDTMYLAGPGTTGSRTLAQYGCCTALKTDTTTWVISGTGLT